MADIGVLLALRDEREAELVQLAEAPGTGVSIVRRCADVVELMAAARAGLGSLAVISDDLPGADRLLVSDLAHAGVASALLVDMSAHADGYDDVARLVLDARESPQTWLEQLQDLASEIGIGTAAHPGASAGGAAARTAPKAPDVRPELGATEPDPRGTLVAVWGSSGSPGRSTIAANLAAHLAQLDGTALLVDADTEAPSQAVALGLLDESSGIASLCRLAAAGRLDASALAGASQRLDEGLAVITGLTRPDRWRELAAPALEQVWNEALAAHRWVVADLGPSIGDASGPPTHRSHFEATSSTLEQADVIVTVGASEPVALTRLVRTLVDGRETGVLADRRTLTVVNRVRRSSAGSRPHEAIRESLARFAGVHDPVLIPDDRPACDAASLEGRILSEYDPHSEATLAIRAMAQQLTGVKRSRREDHERHRTFLTRWRARWGST